MAEKPYGTLSWHKIIVDNCKQNNPRLSNYSDKQIFEAWAEWYRCGDSSNEEEIADFIEEEGEN